MTEPGQLRPGRVVPGLALRRTDSTSPLVRTLTARIGTPYGWRSAARTPEQWDEWLAHPLRRYWVITAQDETAGFTALEPQADGDLRITTFGLLPEYVGRGLGGHALTLALRQAWATEAVGAPRVRRVWLSTNNRDHPNALRNYEARGMRPFRTETRQD
ncbi:GNAT family N-acetyltransferase [Streptomyces armeniacus]|nr:GNAT family N-acetyltransferase [Streptomyces armeniacus]